MTYLGGKNRLGKKIAAILAVMRGNRPYLEPFAGGAGVLVHVEGHRIASDIDADVVAMWRAARDGWVPPPLVTEADYSAARADPLTPAHLKGFIKYACSWGGKPWGGYARGNRSYAALGSRGVAAKAARLVGVTMVCCSYDDIEPDGALVYCDPPYAGVTGYGIAFDHGRFWDVMRRWSMRNTVVISERSAPADARRIIQFSLGNKLNGACGSESLWTL